MTEPRHSLIEFCARTHLLVMLSLVANHVLFIRVAQTSVPGRPVAMDRAGARRRHGWIE
jgi:hypothetical protein